MKAQVLAEFVITAFKDSRLPASQRVEQALLEGVGKLFIEHAARLQASSGAGKLSVLREMFSFWKAVSGKLVGDPRWPDPPGPASLYKAVTAFPVSLERHDSANFLMLLDRSVFLGWEPDEAMKGRISQYRWYQPTQMRPKMAGLAGNHVRR